ncbi:hypothetical protein AAIH37_27680, partial [Pseudomonas aeruginosa]
DFRAAASRLNSAENVRRCLLIRHLSHGEDFRLNRCPGSVDHYIERFKYQCKTSTVNSMAKLLKVAEAASSGNEVVQIAVYGRRKQVYTLHPA